MTLSPNYPGYYLGHVGYAYRLSGIVLAAAEELCVPLPLASLPRDRFLTLMAHGGDELLDGVLPNACREELVADDAVDHSVNFAVCQPVDGEGGHVGPSDPGWLELWSERHDQHHAEAWYSVHDATEQFEARRVGPMCVLENHLHRILAR
jgi:hypothetical protein